MQTSAPRTQHAIKLDRSALDKIRRSAGIETESELAARIGVNETTLWRVTRGNVTPSNGFIAATLVAFPKAKFADLFKVTST